METNFISIKGRELESSLTYFLKNIFLFMHGQDLLLLYSYSLIILKY